MKRFLLVIAFLSSYLFVGTFAFGAQGVSVNVSLFPVGSFEMTSDKIEGKGAKSGSSYAATSLKVPVSSLKTGISLRDEHLREKLKEKEHPFIIVSDIAAAEGKGTANISVTGIVKPIKFTYKDNGDGTAEASFPLDLTDFKIEGISFKGVGVEDEVQVKAMIEYEQK